VFRVLSLQNHFLLFYLPVSSGFCIYFHLNVSVAVQLLIFQSLPLAHSSLKMFIIFGCIISHIKMDFQMMKHFLPCFPYMWPRASGINSAILAVSHFCHKSCFHGDKI
jgi:hypothetical protein